MRFPFVARWALALLLVMVVAALASSSVRASRRDARRRAVAEAYQRVEVCLYGGTLPPNESGALRARYIEICDDPRLKRRTGGCEDELAALLGAWDAFGVSDADPVYGPSRRATAVALGAAALSAGERESAWAALVAATRASDLPALAPVEGLYCTDTRPELAYRESDSLAPARYRLSVFEESRMTPSSDYLWRRGPTEEALLGSAVRGLWNPWDGQVGCWLGAGEIALGSCASASGALMLYDAPEGFTDVLVGGRGEHGSMRPHHRVGGVMDGAAEIVGLHEPPRGVWVQSAGALTALRGDGKLEHFVAGRSRGAVELPESDHISWTHIAPGWVLGRERVERAEHVFAAVVGGEGRAVGAARDLGIIGEWSELRGCRLADGGTRVVFVAVSTCRVPERCPTHMATVTLSLDGTASTLRDAVLDLPGRTPDDVPSWLDHRACTSAGVPRWAFRGQGIEEVTCPDAGCAQRKLEAWQDAPHATAWDVVPVGDDEIVVVDSPHLAAEPTQASSEPLRARIGKLNELAKAPRRILLDVARKVGDPDSVYSNVHAHGRGDVAWVTGSIRNELFALRLRPGKAAEMVRAPPP